jgi:hypothetical protein
MLYVRDVLREVQGTGGMRGVEETGGEQKEVTNNMLKAGYPDHHLRHNPRNKEKIDESNRGGLPSAQEAGSDTIALPLTEAQIPGGAV